MNTFWKYIFPSLFWMCVMALVLFGRFSKSMFPDMSLSHVDKLVHFFLFFVLGVCYYWTLRFVFVKTTLYSWVFSFVVIIGISVAGLTELIQEYCLSHRRGEWADFCADAFGIVIGSLLFKRVLSHHFSS